MPTINRNYEDVTPAGGLFAGTEWTFQKTFYSDAAKTTEVDPTSVAVEVTAADDSTTTPTPTNPSTGVYKQVVSLLSGTTLVKWTATDASGNDLIDYQYAVTSD